MLWTIFVILVRKGKETISPSKDIGKYVRLQQPRMLTYDELVALGSSDKLSGGLGDKLHTILFTI